MSLVFAILAALVAGGAVFMALDPLLRYARASAADAEDDPAGSLRKLQETPADAATLEAIEREVRALRARRGPATRAGR